MAFGSRKNDPPDDTSIPQTAEPEELLLGLGMADAPGPAPADGSSDSDSVAPAPPPAATVVQVQEVAVVAAADKGPSIFRNRNFMLLWIAQALTQTAQNALNITLILFVGDLTNQSSFYKSIISTAFVVPGVIFSALAGVLVDRFEKRRVLIAANFLRALVVLPLILIDTNFPVAIALPAIFIITIIFSTISQFFGPAEGSMIPLLVGRRQFVVANSLFNITLAGATLLGFAIIGPILSAIIGNRNLFIMIAIVYAVSTLLVWLLPRHLEAEIAQAHKSSLRDYAATIWPELIEGWNFIRRDRAISVAIIFMSMVMAVLFTVGAIGSTFVVVALHLPSSGLAWVMAPAGFGLIVGVLLVNRWAARISFTRMIIGGTFAIGAIVMALSLLKAIGDFVLRLFGQPDNSYSGAPLLGPIIILSVILGLGLAFVLIPGQTVLQDRSPEDVRGRVFAAYFTFSNFVSIFPILIAGGLSDIIGVVPVMLMIGIIVTAMGGIGVLQNRPKAQHVP